jgi:uncharacterized protein YjiS (DUF1127 family)
METTAPTQPTPIRHANTRKHGASFMFRLIAAFRRAAARPELMRLGEHRLRDIGRDRDEALREARRRYMSGSVPW